MSCAVHLCLSAALAGAPDLPPPSGLVTLEADPLTDIADLLERRRPMAASALAEATWQDGGPDGRAARVLLADALEMLALDEAARLERLAVVGAGVDDRAGRQALSALLQEAERDEALAVLARALGPAGIVPTPGGPAADARTYVRALQALDFGDRSAALDGLSRVSGSLATRARLVEAAIVGPLDPRRAWVLSDAAIQGAPDPALADAARIHAARVAHGAGVYGEAIALYDAIPPTSPHWATAREEQAWSYLLNGERTRAVGNVVALSGPWTEGEPVPEATLVAGIAALEACDFRRAGQLAQALHTTHDPTVAALDAWLDTATPATAWREWFGSSGAPLGLRGRENDVPVGLFRVVLRDSELRARAERLAALEAEQAQVVAHKALWFEAVGARLLDGLAAAAEAEEVAAGARLIGLLERERDRLAEALAHADVLHFEATDASRVVLQELAAAPTEAAGEGRVLDYAVATNLIAWPFNGELWEDELDGYRVERLTSCDAPRHL